MPSWHILGRILGRTVKGRAERCQDGRLRFFIEATSSAIRASDSEAINGDKRAANKAAYRLVTGFVGGFVGGLVKLSDHRCCRNINRIDSIRTAAGEFGLFAK